MKWTRTWTRRTIGIGGLLILFECLVLRAGRSVPNNIDGALEMVGLFFLVLLFQYLIFVPSSKDR
jgi:hypothetical protein